jgi:flagellar motor switch protein FliG
MEQILSADDMVRIHKSNKALEVLATLPADQRTSLIEGIVAALQLSEDQVADIKKRTMAFAWWTDATDE